MNITIYSNGTISCTFTKSDLVTIDEAERIKNDFLHLIEGMVNNDGRPIDS